MQIVLDSNILVSGILSPGGPPGQLIAAWKNHRFLLISSNMQLERLEKVFKRPKLSSMIEQQEATDLLSDIVNAAMIVEPECNITASTDPEDNCIIGMAIAGRADFLVSGDKKHMLVLGEVEGIPIITAREALEKIAKPFRRKTS